MSQKIVAVHILKDYCYYISDLNYQLNGDLPEDIKDWNINNWMNFSINHDLDIPEDIDFGFGNYRNQYIYVIFNLKGKWKENPYAEIRSREFWDNKFKLKILLYGVEESYLEDIDKWKSDFAKSELFSPQSYKKQIAINSVHEEIYNLEELKNLLKKYIDEYLRIML